MKAHGAGFSAFYVRARIYFTTFYMANTPKPSHVSLSILSFSSSFQRLYDAL